MSTTVINTPPASSQSNGNGLGFLLGILILVIGCGVFYFYALPSIKQFMNKGVQVNVDLPSKVNVNIQQPEIKQ
jgi:hypothetical protein